jgi:hypothetical protein
VFRCALRTIDETLVINGCSGVILDNFSFPTSSSSAPAILGFVFLANAIYGDHAQLYRIANSACDKSEVLGPKRECSSCALLKRKLQQHLSYRRIKDGRIADELEAEVEKQRQATTKQKFLDEEEWERQTLLDIEQGALLNRELLDTKEALTASEDREAQMASKLIHVRKCNKANSQRARRNAAYLEAAKKYIGNKIGIDISGSEAEKWTALFQLAKERIEKECAAEPDNEKKQTLLAVFKASFETMGKFNKKVGVMNVYFNE